MAKQQDSLLEHLAKMGSNLPEETVNIEEWGREVTLRGMSSRERDLFEETNMRRAAAQAKANGAQRLETDLTNFRARLVARHIIEGGVKVFANPRGEELLGDQPASILDKLFDVAQKLSGFSKRDVEELTKNLGTIPGEEASSSSLGSREEQSLN